MAEAGLEGTVAEIRSQLEGEVAETNTKGMVVSQASKAGKPRLKASSVGEVVDRH